MILSNLTYINKANVNMKIQNQITYIVHSNEIIHMHINVTDGTNRNGWVMALDVCGLMPNQPNKIK